MVRKDGNGKMPLNRDEHNNLLSELLTPELDASRRTEILETIRDNYTEFSASTETLMKEKEKLEKDNSALVVANSKLFRSAGIVVDEPPKNDPKKEISKTITIDQLGRK